MVFLLIFSLLLSGLFVNSKSTDDRHENFKLEDFNIYPISYELQLWFNIELYRIEDKNYAASEKITFTSKVPVSKFSIDCGGDIEIVQINLLKGNAYAPGQLEYKYNSEKEKIEIEIFGATIEPFINYSLTFNFSNKISNENEGIFITDYFVDHKEDQKRSYVGTNFLSNSVHRFFPCFNNIAFKSTLKLHINHNKEYTAISITPGTREHYLKDSFTTNFEETLPISIFSFNFILTEFNSKSLESNDIKFSFYAEDSALLEAEYLLNKSEIIMSKVEEYFGMKYPLNKIDVYIHKDTLNNRKFGNEDFGLVSVFESEFLINPDAVPFDRSIQGHRYALHAFIRQYLGNIVTPQQWSDNWIFGSLVNFIHFELLEEIMQNDHLVDWLLVDDPELQEGEAVFRMVSHIIGKDTFKKAIQYFIQENKFKGANIDDIYSAFNHAVQDDQTLLVNVDLQTFIESWINKPGLPILYVSRDYVTGNITLTQNRSLSIYSDKNIIENTSTWWIPYNFVSKGDHDYTITKPIGFMENIDEKEFNPHVSNDEWIIFNKKGTYNYIVNYDIENWKMISKELNDGDFEKIHYLNRAQLIHDVYYLTKNGYLDYKVLFDILNYVRRETNYVVWKAIDFISEDILTAVQNTEFFSYFPRYIKMLSSNLYYKYSMETDNVDEAAIKSYLTKWACFERNNIDCIDDATTTSNHVINSLLHNTPTKINPSLYHIILCYGVNDVKYTKLWHDLAIASYTTRNAVISSLHCNYKKTVFKDFLLKVYTKQTLQPEFDQAEENRITFFIKNNYFNPTIATAVVLKEPALLFDNGNEKNLIEYLNSTINNAHVGRRNKAFDVFDVVRTKKSMVTDLYGY